jgi:cellular nucleic acid-binding protein
MATIYILRLEGGRYYVGKSDNPYGRYQQHVAGNGSAWTRKYPPIGIVKTIPGSSPFDEDRYVKEYVSIYGVQNVRGGSYSEVTLSVEQKQTLEREIRGATDACMKCGRTGHFANNCYAKTTINSSSVSYESEEEWECEYCDRTFTTRFGCAVHEKTCKRTSNVCYRCGRDSHYSPDCYASRHVDGSRLD